MNCLVENTVLQLVQGRLPPEARAEAERHIDQCPDCLRVVAETAKYFYQDGSLAATVPARVTSGQLAPGHTVSRYVVGDAIGSGGMGVVYEAFDPQLDRKVALKLLRADGADTASQARLAREAQAMAKLSHPNVVAVYDAGEYEGRVFVAMELISGRTLARWLAEEPRTWRQVVDAFAAAGRGLAAAHAAGLVHRDFKPHNVLIGGDGRVRVTDFGLARGLLEGEGAAGLPAAQAMLLGAATRTGSFAGTPAYMAPEQFTRGPTDARTDQFAFCVAFYEALYGERPFVGDTILVLGNAVTAGVLPMRPKGRDVPAWLDAILVRGLAVAPERRFASLDALLAELERGTARPRRSRTRFALAGAGAVVLAGGVVAALTWSAPPAQSTPSTPTAPSPASDMPATPAPPPPPPHPVPDPTPAQAAAAPEAPAPTPKRKPARVKRKPTATATTKPPPDSPLDPWHDKH